MTKPCKHDNWRKIVDSDGWRCIDCNARLTNKLDLNENPVSHSGVDVEISGHYPTTITIQRAGKTIDKIIIYDEGGYEGAYTVEAHRIVQESNHTT